MSVRTHIASHYMDVAELSAVRSTCLRRHVGAVAIKDNRILATGFNGNVSGTPHCSICIREQKGIKSGEDVATCFAIHAEANLVAQAAIFGISLVGATVYVTNQPCLSCLKLLLQVKVRAIIFKDTYPDSLAMEFLEKASWRSSQYEHDNFTYTILRPIGNCTPLMGVFKGEECKLSYHFS